MSVGIFFFGLILMALGAVFVWKGARFYEWFGEVSYLLGMNSDWLTWPVLGTIFLIVGFLLATGLFSAAFSGVIGGVTGLAGTPK